MLATVPAIAADGADAELRALWAKYLVQLEVYRPIANACHKAYRALTADVPVGYGGDPKWQARWNRASQKHGYDQAYEKWNHEGDELERIARAIRKAKAESLFGIGVKLSLFQGDFSDIDLTEIIDDARKAITELTGVDFIAATGKLDV
jgi:hypothetical protein